MTSATPPTYALDSLDLQKLLRRVAAKGLSPTQAEQLLAKASQPGVRLLRGLIGSLVGLVFLGVGVFLLGLARTSYRETQAFARHARLTTGRVVALSRHAIGNNQPTYAPIVVYQAGGQMIRLEGLATSPAAYSVGQTLPIGYDPARPQAGRILSFVEQWLLALIAGGVGILLTMIGLGIGWVTLRMGLRSARVSPETMQQVLAQLAAGQLTVEAAHHQLRRSG